MRLAFFGDIVGKSGRLGLNAHLPDLRARLKLDFVVANGENAAGGFGITRSIADEIYASGVDCITLGNHAFDQREILGVLDDEPRMLRCANYPALTRPPGRGAHLYQCGEKNILVVSVMGRLYMDALDCPFSALEREISQAPLRDIADAIIVDVHAEASGEKQGIGHFLDGRVSMVVGSHTHVPTADARVLEHGTAYMTDAGMCGDYDSVIGMNKAISVERQSVRLPGQRHEAALGPAMVCGFFVETDDRTGLAVHAAPIRIGTGLATALPAVG